MAGKVKCIECGKKVSFKERGCSNCGKPLDESVSEAIKGIEGIVWRKNVVTYFFSVALIVFSSVSIVPENMAVGVLLIVSAFLRLPVISEIVLGQLTFLSARNYLLMTTVLIIGGLLMSGIKTVENTEVADNKPASTTALPAENRVNEQKTETSIEKYNAVGF